MSRRKRTVLLLFFDLPVITKESRKIYGTFKKKLKQNGFFQFQKSVYVKLIQNSDAKRNEMLLLSDNIPANGMVSMMTISINQFKNIKMFGEKRFNMELFADDFVVL